MNKNIKRPRYINHVRPFYNKQMIKVLTGQRRVGKSYILMQIRDELTNQFPNSNFIFIDKEKFEFDYIRDYISLMEYVKSKEQTGQNYLFIDEVQEISGFEKTLRSLLSDGNYDIYCTGSNSEIFSSELTGFLSGRQIELKIHSLSYPEFLEFHNLKTGKKALYIYLKYGGLPYLIHLPKDDEIVFDYLKNILATILYRDVISRNDIRDIAFFSDLVKFLADATGSVLSATNISKYLKSQKQSKSVSIIINYLRFLENAGIISKVNKKDIKGKRNFETNSKYYFEDIGLRNASFGYRPDDINKIIENVVFNHLQFLGYKVYSGKLDKKEIDFVAEKENETIYIQVAYLLADEKVIQREFGNLNEIKDHFPKYVVSMDEFPIRSSFKGIKHITLDNFLTKGL